MSEFGEAPPTVEADARTPPPQLRDGPKSALPRDAKVNPRGPTRPAAASPAEVTEPSVVATALDLVKRHRLLVVGRIGMMLAFVVGVALARWAAEAARTSAVPVPIEVRKPPHK